MRIRIQPILLTFAIIMIASIIGTSCKSESSIDNLSTSESKYRGQKSIIINDLPKTDVLYDTSIVNFGDTKDGTVLRHTFYLINAGKESLIIKQARTTCGCTVADVSKEPTPPGDSAKIEIQFNTQNRLGMNKKQIQVYSNATAGVILFTFTANVVK